VASAAAPVGAVARHLRTRRDGRDIFRPRTREQALLPAHESPFSDAQTTTTVDTATQAVLDVHCTTEKRHDTQLGWQLARRNAGELRSLAADKGYDWQQLREKLREEGVRPLIKHREFRSIDPRVVRVIDGALYGQRALSETVFSTIKRTLGHAVRARAWYREFREIVLMCAVYNIKRAVP